jgi:signal transduction histidine kinase
LVRRERLAMLGQLSGSMAHEIRNPLGVIRNAVYYLRATSDQFDDEAKQCLSEIETEVQSADHIVTELLDYTREAKHNAKPFRLVEAVDRALETTEIPDSIQVERVVGVGALDVLADRGQIERIVGNVLRNAVQAMPGRGTLSVTCDERDGEATVKVEDTGVGIAEEDIERVFEALFTRKAKGIGLGLAISKRYAELNHGRLEVRSKLGEGSTFELFLPLADESDVEEIQ